MKIFDVLVRIEEIKSSLEGNFLPLITILLSVCASIVIFFSHVPLQWLIVPGVLALGAGGWLYSRLRLDRDDKSSWETQGLIAYNKAWNIAKESAKREFPDSSDSELLLNELRLRGEIVADPQRFGFTKKESACLKKILGDVTATGHIAPPEPFSGAQGMTKVATRGPASRASVRVPSIESIKESIGTVWTRPASWRLARTHRERFLARRKQQWRWIPVFYGLLAGAMLLLMTDLLSPVAQTGAERMSSLRMVASAALVVIGAVLGWMFLKPYIFLCDHCGVHIRTGETWNCRCGHTNHVGIRNSFLQKCNQCEKMPSALLCPSCEELIFLDGHSDDSNVAHIHGGRSLTDITKACEQKEAAERQAWEKEVERERREKELQASRERQVAIAEKKEMAELVKQEIELLRRQQEREQYQKPRNERGASNAIETNVRNLLERIRSSLGNQQAAENVREQMRREFAHKPELLARIECIIEEWLEEHL